MSEKWVLSILEWSVTLGIVGTVLGLFKKYWSRISSYRGRRSMEKVMAVTRIMRELRLALQCNRTIIVRSHNGDGIPHVLQSTRATILYEDCKDEAEYITEDWQARELVGFSRLVVENIVENKDFHLHIDDVPKTSVLRGVYEANNISYAWHKEILMGVHGYYFLICWFEEKIKPPNIAAMEESVERLKKIFV